MPQTVTQSKGTSGAGGATQVLSFNSLPAVGSTIYVFAGTDAFAATANDLTVTDNQSGNTYTRDYDPGGTWFGVAAFSAVCNGSAGTFTITLHSAGNVASEIYIVEVAGSSVTKDVTLHTGGAGSPAATGNSAATATANQIVFAWAVDSSSDNAPPTVGNDLGANNDYNHMDLSYKVVSATGAQSETWSNGSLWDTLLISYQAASASSKARPLVSGGLVNTGLVNNGLAG